MEVELGRVITATAAVCGTSLQWRWSWAGSLLRIARGFICGGGAAVVTLQYNGNFVPSSDIKPPGSDFLSPAPHQRQGCGALPRCPLHHSRAGGGHDIQAGAAGDGLEKINTFIVNRNV